MQIGIDATFLLSTSRRSGIYIYIRELLDSLYRILFPGPVTLFLANYPDPVDTQMYADLQRTFRGWPSKLCNQPRWAYNFRMRHSAFARMEVFHFPVISNFSPDIKDRANVFTIPDLTFIHYPQHHLPGIVKTWLSFCDRAVKHGDMILTYSEHTRQDISRTLGVPETKICATPLAASASFQPIPDRALLQEQLSSFGLRERKYILSVGTVEPRKNQVRLIGAFARLLRGDPSLPHLLVFAGERGWHSDPIIAKVAQEGIENRVLFLGRSDPLEVLYNGADLMVYPSLYEGFGLPPLEAMACGTPVITSNRSSLPEVVGDTAVLVDPEDEIALCEAMRRVLQDGKLREELATKGPQRARLFSWYRTAAATLEAYNKAYQMKS